MSVGVWAREHATRLASRATQGIGLAAGRSAPYWYVSEYPKSGGTWLAQMVAGYLEIPFPQHYLLPPVTECVVHNHWLLSRRRRRCLYLYRDGRDIMVSLYFHRMRRLAAGATTPFLARLARDYDAAFGVGYDPADCAANLARFIEVEVRNPRGSRHDWLAHVRSWCGERHADVSYLAYEDLLRDPVATLSRGLGKFLERPIDGERLERVVERFSFARQSGRRPGDEDRGSFLRKGIAGDWKNHFTPEAAEVFERHLGEGLLLLGYEAEPSWVEQVGSPTDRGSCT